MKSIIFTLVLIAGLNARAGVLNCELSVTETVPVKFIEYKPGSSLDTSRPIPKARILKQKDYNPKLFTDISKLEVDDWEGDDNEGWVRYYHADKKEPYRFAIDTAKCFRSTSDKDCWIYLTPSSHNIFHHGHVPTADTYRGTAPHYPINYSLYFQLVANDSLMKVKIEGEPGDLSQRSPRSVFHVAPDSKMISGELVTYRRLDGFELNNIYELNCSADK